MGRKKKSKHKSKNKYSSSSSSSSSNEEEWVEMPSKSSSASSASKNSSSSRVETKNNATNERDGWLSLPGIIPCVSKDQINTDRRTERRAKELQAQEEKTYKPGQSERELNPYWKNGGTGVPENKKGTVEPHLVDTHVGDRGLDWLRKALVRTQEQATAEGRNLEDVAVERWGSLNKLYELIEEAEKQSKRKEHKSSRHSSRKEGHRRRDHSRDHSRDCSRDRSRDCSRDRNRNRKRDRSREHSRDRSSRRRHSRSRSLEHKGKDRRGGSEIDRKKNNSKNFQVPDENEDFRMQNKSFVNHGERSLLSAGRARPSWRKKSPERKISFDRKISPTRLNETCVQATSAPEEEHKDQPEETSVLSENEIAAKMMKAELLGNNALVGKLKRQLEMARKKNQASSTSKERNRVKEEVVILTSTDKKGFTKPVSATENPYGDARGRKKKEKVVTHQDGKRQRYFADDDKYTLQNMFEREKLETVEDSNALFAKLAFKSKVGEDDSAFDMEDVFMEQASRKDSAQKQEEKQRSQAIARHKHSEKILENCIHCLESDKMLKHTIINIGNKCYICVPSYQSLTEGHCLIVPSNHVACATLLDEEVWEEMQGYRKKLTRLFLAQDEDVIFFESARGFGRLPHMNLHCVPVPKEIGDMAPIFFKKAILECETEWSTNKKVVDLSQKSIRRAVPKGLPYFAVDFGLQGGFAHVIEDEKLFPRNFAQEIIGGMMDLDHSTWRKERAENFEDIRRKVVSLTKLWREQLKRDKSDS